MAEDGRTEQLGLFGASVASLVKPVVTDRDRVTDAKLPANIRYGTSSWTFPGWKGIVYEGEPSQAELVRDGLAAYARHPLMRTVGIDRSHYAPLSSDDLRKYAADLPDSYWTLSKVWDGITARVFPAHPRYGARAGMENPKFLDPETTLREVIEPYAEHFAEHAGPFVFEIAPIPSQLIPPPHAFARAVESLLAALPKTFRYAFELRNQELLSREYASVLRAFGATHVFNYWTGAASIAEQAKIFGPRGADFLVARLMIPPFVRYEVRREQCAPFNAIVAPEWGMRHDALKLAKIAAANGRDLFILVGNKAEGSAPLTVRALAEAVVESLDRDA